MIRSSITQQFTNPCKWNMTPLFKTTYICVKYDQSYNIKVNTFLLYFWPIYFCSVGKVLKTYICIDPWSCVRYLFVFKKCSSKWKVFVFFTICLFNDFCYRCVLSKENDFCIESKRSTYGLFYFYMIKWRPRALTPVLFHNFSYLLHPHNW